VLWNLKIRLAEANLTQRDLAKRVGVSDSFLCSIIRGRYIANSDLRRRVSDVLGTDVRILFSEEVSVSAGLVQAVGKPEPTKL
jgi:transcriptional regulator with XRE-family HTH domain